MSWKDRLENRKLIITTGDGKVYEPYWRSSEKEKDFNASRYDFIDVSKSLIDRKRPQSNKFPLVFFFQGDDNIEQCDAFEESANDSRFWKMEHPFYGTIKGQPLKLKRNDDSFNITEVSVEFWESISEDYPLSEISSRDKTLSKVNELNSLGVAMMVENSTPDSSNIIQVKDSINSVSSNQSPDLVSFNDYQNLTTKALKAADKLISDTETALQAAQDVISSPPSFETPVQRRIKSFIKAYYQMKELIDDVFSKIYFEGQGASLIASICQSAMNPMENDYITRSDIENVNEQILEIYSDYLNVLDINQVQLYDTDNSWIPNSAIQSQLYSLVSFVSNNLFQLSFDARQERIFILPEDSNLIVLCHRFMGLDSEDKNMELFRKINNIKNKELYSIKKGREIKYFI